MKGMDFNAFKNSMDGVGVFRCKLLCFFERGGFHDDQASGLVREWSSKQNFPLAMERL